MFDRILNLPLHLPVCEHIIYNTIAIFLMNIVCRRKIKSKKQIWAWLTIRPYKCIIVKLQFDHQKRLLFIFSE